MTSKNMKIQIATGLEATPIAMLVQLANQFESKIYLEVGTRKINAKSIMGMMSLGATTGDSVTIYVDGVDESKAMQTISDYLSGNRD